MKYSPDLKIHVVTCQNVLKKEHFFLFLKKRNSENNLIAFHNVQMSPWSQSQQKIYLPSLKFDFSGQKCYLFILEIFPSITHMRGGIRINDELANFA